MTFAANDFHSRYRKRRPSQPYDLQDTALASPVTSPVNLVTSSYLKYLHFQGPGSKLHRDAKHIDLPSVTQTFPGRACNAPNRVVQCATQAFLE